VKIVPWGALFGLLAYASPAGAIVIANTSYSATVSYGEVADGVNLSGVTEITSVMAGNTYGCTGSLLSDGFSILTAGHCVTTSGGSALPSGITVYFQGPSGMVAETVSNVQIDPAYSVGNSQNGSDLAVLTLSQQAPAFAAEYSLYTGTTVLNTPVVIAGYGLSGTGANGANGSFGTLQVGENQYEGNGSQFFGYSSQLLVGELYEKGVPSTNALGCYPRYFDACSLAAPYDASDEVDISSGDSGGPTFYDGQIIGVHDLGICATAADSTSCSVGPSINAANNSYFGELFADTSAAANLAFIESSEVEVPEPGTMGMLGLGFAAFGAIAYRRRRCASASETSCLE
jgi:hypothetical protein